MKKIISILLCLAAIIPSSAYAKNSSDEMKTALAAVKTKIEIPDDLTEFDSESMNDNGDISFFFYWRNDKASKSAEVRCDSAGRIESYSTWNSDREKTSRLSDITKESALELAENFLKKCLPEAFSPDDTLIYDTLSTHADMSPYGTTYRFTFIRSKNGIQVHNNTVTVNVTAEKDGIKVSNLYSEYDHDADFADFDSQIEDPELYYKQEFPISMYYRKDYSNSKDAGKDVTMLLYRPEEYGAGYISAVTGKKVTERFDRNLESRSAKSLAYEEAADMAAGAFEYTRQELAELENIAGLKSASEIEKSLRGIYDLKLTNSMKLQYSNISKRGSRYIMNLSIQDEGSRNLWASVDAQTGKIIYLSNRNNSRPYNSKPQDSSLTAAQKTKALSKINAFFKAAAPDVCSMFTEEAGNDTLSTVSCNFVREANGVKYIDNRANISYDTENEMIVYYSLDFSDAVFDDPKSAVGADVAYDNLLKKSPLKQIYLLTDSGKYEVCYKMTFPYTEVDALTGDAKLSSDNKRTEYTDISGHWCETAVQALADVGVYLEGDEFRPDENITKTDLLELFSAGFKDHGYIYYKDYGSIDELKRTGIINEQEGGADMDSPVTREDACVYMIRMAGHENIAKLDIFKTNFSDADLVSPDKLGYAAILSGMGVVSGSDGYLRPKDNITNAEAAVMLYNYLIRN